MEAWAKIYKELLEYNKRQTDFFLKKEGMGKRFEQTLYQREHRWQVSHEDVLTTSPHPETEAGPYWGITIYPLERGIADMWNAHRAHMGMKMAPLL